MHAVLHDNCFPEHVIDRSIKRKFTRFDAKSQQTQQNKQPKCQYPSIVDWSYFQPFLKTIDFCGQEVLRYSDDQRDFYDNPSALCNTQGRSSCISTK